LLCLKQFIVFVCYDLHEELCSRNVALTAEENDFHWLSTAIWINLRGVILVKLYCL